MKFSSQLHNLLDLMKIQMHIIVIPKIYYCITKYVFRRNTKIDVKYTTFMQRTSVTSSNIASIGYEDNVLEIEFHSEGSIYRYFQVPEQEYKQLMSASSHGKYLNQNIKNKYKYEKIS